MNKHVFQKFCILLLAICLMIPSVFAEQAQGDDDDPIVPQYTGISMFRTSLSISTSGKATCQSATSSTSPSYSVVLTMKLQQSTDNVSWSTIKTWTTPSANAPSLDKDYYVVSGYYYRLYCTAKVYNGSGTYLGTNTKVSSVESY